MLTSLLLLSLTTAAEAKRAPNLELKTLTGETRKLADLHGSIVVLNFWATWCGPCREELPLISTLNQSYAGKKIRFIAVSADAPKDRAKIDEFLHPTNLGLEVWIGADLDLLQRLGLGNELPATLIVDEQGEIVTRILGEAREQDIRGSLDWLLSNRSGPAPAAIIKRY
jgi:thiol-disulfide isomerase/thioredoxin